MLGVDKENEFSDNTIMDSMRRSKELSSAANLVLPEYLESVISPHKSCKTCAKINNFIHKSKDPKL